MTNEERNTALYQKMFAEQETYRKWLLTQPPEEILKHTYEYTVREDILLSLEYHDLTDAQANALLKSPNALGDVFKEFESRETGYMDVVFDAMERRANTVIQAEAEQRRVLLETPVYPYPADHAHENGEPEQYRASRKANSNTAFVVNASHPGLTDREGHFMLISRDEDRSQPLKKPRRSVRKNLQKTSEKSDLGATKKKKPEREVR